MQQTSNIKQRMKVKDIKSPVSSVSGVGPQLTKLLAKINIFTAGDLLSYYPKDYEDLSVKVPLCDFKIHSKIHTVARVVRHEWFGYGRMKTLKIIINDQTASAELICFNRGFLEKVLIPGSIISVSGQFFVKYGKLQSSAFDAARIDLNTHNIPVTGDGLPDLLKMNPPDMGIKALYPLTDGLTQKTLSKAIGNAILQYAHGIEDEVPEEIIRSRSLLSKQEAIKLIHQPQNMGEAMAAKKTLVYEELFQLESVIAQRAFKHRGYIPDLESSENPQAKNISYNDFKISLSPLQQKLLEKLPFQLTEDQKNVIYEMDNEIDRGFMERNAVILGKDSKLPFTMARLLQGDVGSGKTLTALFACLRVISYKGQCAFMAPTEILARQHAETTSKLLDSIGVRIAFLTGNTKSAGRSQLLKALKNGEIDIIVGTHALFSAQVVYKDLQLAVIDEQHRFGVMQRQSIIAKGRKTEENGITFEPHLLMMSATPIPRTLALTVFGDLDVSTIKTMPQGRKPIQTYLVKEGNEKNAYDAVRKELGHQGEVEGV